MRLFVKITEQDLAEKEQFKAKTYLENIPELNNKIRFQNSLVTVVYSDVRRNLRVWVQNIFAPLLNAILYFIVFGYLIGSKIGPIHNIPYIQFLVPGYMVMPIVSAAFSNGAFSTFREIYFHTIQEIQRAPIQTHTFMIGLMISTLCRVFIVAGFIYLASILITQHITIEHPVFLLFLVIIITLAFTMIGILNGILANSFEEINFIPIFVLTPLLYLSGMFIPLNSLPPFVAHLSLINPLVYIVSSIRYAFLGFIDVNLYSCVSFLIVFFIILYVITYKAIIKRVHLH